MTNRKLIFDIQKEIVLLTEVTALLDWDQKTYMPKAGNANRAEQISLISALIHQRYINPQLAKALKASLKKCTAQERTEFNKLYKEVSRARKLPESFVRNLSSACTLASNAWEEAKLKSSFALFRPHLEKVVKLKRQEAKLIGKAKHPYDNLLDEYDEGMTTEKLKTTFDYLKPRLIELLTKISKYQRKWRVAIPSVKIDDQKELLKQVKKIMQLPKDKTRMDVSVHPFTTSIGYGDTRITTHFDESKPLSSLLGTVHEAGHALYELGLPKEDRFKLIGQANSLSLHESQSRFWEIMVVKSKPFLRHFFPILRTSWRLSNHTLESFYYALNRVKPDLIRIHANEVTYCLHVILRFEIEADLIAGKIQVRDLPKIWNEKMKAYLDITPNNDAEGVLQDCHWSIGAIGYFPTYAIGTIYASQLFHQLTLDNPNTIKEIEHGDFSNIIAWLHKKVHRHGSKFTSEEIIKKVCGTGLDPHVFMSYLEGKYSKLYNF